MSKPYFMVVSRAPSGERLHPQFGDFKRAVALDEMRDLRRSEDRQPRASRCELRMIRAANATQAACDAALAAFNAATK